MNNYTVKEEKDNLWIIEEENVRSFLIVGTEQALLIDSGCGIDDIKGIVEGITKLPVTLVNTHVDMDHTNCNWQFSRIFMHPSEYFLYHRNMGRNDRIEPLWDGTVFSLGDREIVAVMNPGHTSGSVTFLDTKGRRIVGGDSIQNGRIFLFGETRDLLAFAHSMRRMENFLDKVDKVYPSHADCPVDAGIIPKLAEGVERMLRGEVKGTPSSYEGTPIREFDIGPAVILYEAEKQFFE